MGSVFAPSGEEVVGRAARASVGLARSVGSVGGGKAVTSRRSANTVLPGQV